MTGTEYFGETTVQPRDHIPVNTMRESHTFAALIRLSRTTHNLLTFNISEISSNNSEKLSLLPDKHLWTFSYTRLIEVPGCKDTRSADHLSLVVFMKVHLQFCSHLIHLTPKSLFPRPKTQWSPQKSEQYRTFLSKPGSGRLIRLAK